MADDLPVYPGNWDDINRILLVAHNPDGTLRSGGGAQATVAASGDLTGAIDTAAIQAAIDTCHTAGGGLVQLMFAPTATPFWITQIAMRAGVVVAGVSPMATVLKAPLGQATNTHMCILGGDTVYEGHMGLRDLTLHGNNGFAWVYPATWGQQTHSFRGISWVGGGSGGLGSLVDPFGTDRLLRLTNVMVVSMPERGVYLENNASGLYDHLYVAWCGSHGIDNNAFDNMFTGCIAGFSGATLAGGITEGSIAGFNIRNGAQLVNCKAWWPQTNFKQTNPITWDAPVGIGFSIGSTGGVIGGNLFAQDCGYGYAIGAGYGARIRGHAESCKVAVNLWGGDDADIDVTVDAIDDGSLVTPQYAIASVHGAAISKSKVRVKYGSGMSFANGVGYFDTNGTALAGSDVEVKCAGSQVVAYAASITPTPYQAPIHYIGTLTGNIAIGAPTNTSGASNFTGTQPYDGQWMELHLTQDGTGGRTVTFNAAYGTPTAIPTTLSTTTVIRFRWDSTQAKWREISRSTSA